MKFIKAVTLMGTAVLMGMAAGDTYAAGSHDPSTLKVALLPDENAATIIQDNKPLAAHLEKATGKKIQLIVTTDYSSMMEATRFGRIDIAYFGPASYTIAKDKMKGGKIDIEPFAARLKRGSTTYQSVIIAYAGSDLKTMADIKGKGIQLAFGDQASTSSHFAPKYTLMQAGVYPGKDYKENFTGAHDAVAKNVERGNAQVGGLSRPIFERLVSRGTIAKDKVRVLGYSEPIPQYPWVMRTDLTEKLQADVRTAFLSLKKGSPEAKKILKPFKADGFAAIKDADYDIIRAIRKNVQGK
ncbi:MAG: phosphate ABC transporter substrate-binding protein [Rhodospirillaceae bacterium]|nr:phosphate ABC transporter substrate-binding protein [Rhodospirillaceae bacterium]|tara:strand:- start:25 stop:918 length:894 start_codon:yes stop_codon:yes gene_type:complete